MKSDSLLGEPFNLKRRKGICSLTRISRISLLIPFIVPFPIIPFLTEPWSLNTSQQTNRQKLFKRATQWLQTLFNEESSKKLGIPNIRHFLKQICISVHPDDSFPDPIGKLYRNGPGSSIFTSSKKVWLPCFLKPTLIFSITFCHYKKRNVLIFSRLF